MFFLICLPICYSEWVISILLSSRSLTHSSVLFSFLLVVFSLVFILAAVFSHSDWLLFIVPGFLLQWSTFLSIAFLNPFSIFITLFWTQGLVDWKGLFHCFFQGIFLFFYWGTSSPLFFLYFSDEEALVCQAPPHQALKPKRLYGSPKVMSKPLRETGTPVSWLQAHGPPSAQVGSVLTTHPFHIPKTASPQEVLDGIQEYFSSWLLSLSCVRPSATPWTAAFQAPPSMGFSR